MDGDAALLQRRGEQRLITLSLADQIGEDRWRERALPGERSIHDVLAHLLAWDEWAVAAFEISAVRTLPPVLQQAFADVNAFNDRAVTRYRNLTRDDLLSGLQSSSARVLASAQQSGGAEWSVRRLTDLAPQPAADAAPDAAPPRAPSVRSILRTLTAHEESHATEVMAAFQIAPRPEHLQPSGADAGTAAGSAGGTDSHS